MDKRVEYSTVGSLGEHFAEAIDITHRGAGLQKIAGAHHPQVARFLRDLRPDPRYQYVLKTPLGAFETWGANRNGDIFPSCSLSFNRDCDNPVPVVDALRRRWLDPHGIPLPGGDYRNFGYRTFLEAHLYQHHQNKDPEKAYGDIVLSVWNEAMQRVEVIARNDREKARRLGAYEIIQDYDDGRPRKISMGCRVSWDVCTICGAVAKSQANYCVHLKTMMGRTMPDGRIVAAVNFFPRFFDLSDVFVPAARESGSLLKVARVAVSQDGVSKVSSAKQAEMSKRVEPNVARMVLNRCASHERRISPEYLRYGDFGSLLKTLAGLGIVLRPEEFQHAALTRSGMGRYADRLDNLGLIFSPPPVGHRREAYPRMRGEFSGTLAEMLKSYIPERSAFSPHLPRRAARLLVVDTGPVKMAMRRAPDTEPLQKIAKMYDSYRRSLVVADEVVRAAMSDHARFYREQFMADVLTDSMSKLSSVRGSLPQGLATLYLYGVYRDSDVTELPAAWDRQPTAHCPTQLLFT